MPARKDRDTTAAAADDVLGYEQARAALADVVATLESGDSTLEEALTLWERGEAYAQACENWLAGADERLNPATEQSSEPTDPPDRPAVQ